MPWAARLHPPYSPHAPLFALHHAKAIKRIEMYNYASARIIPKQKRPQGSLANLRSLSHEVLATQSGLYRVLVAISRLFVLMGVCSPVFLDSPFGVENWIKVISSISYHARIFATCLTKTGSRLSILLGQERSF